MHTYSEVVNDLNSNPDAPDPKRVGDLISETGALWCIGYSFLMDRIDGPHGPKLGTVGYRFVFGIGNRCGVIVDTDRNYNIHEQHLMLPIPDKETTTDVP